MPQRFRRPPGLLTRDAIVGAALTMADRDGLGGLTIRALADALDVPPMTLYSSFSSKNELLDLMYFEVAGRLFASAEGASWQEALRSVGSNMRTLISEHPHWAPLFSRPAPPLQSEGREKLLAALQSAGLPPSEAFLILSSVVLSSLGLMLVELELRAAGGPGVGARLEALREQVDAEPVSQQPVTQQALRKLDNLQLGHLHQRTLELLIRGCEAQLSNLGDS